MGARGFMAGCAPPASDALFRVERFEYVPADLLLRLSLRLALELPSPGRPTLFIEREAVAYPFAPLLACTGRVPLSDAYEWLWRGAFPVPPDLACDQAALFALRLRDDVLLALPAPGERLFASEIVLGTTQTGQRESGRQEPGQHEEGGRTWPYAVRRSALLVALTCQFGVVPGLAAGALAEGSTGAGSGGSTPKAPATPLPGGSTETTPETPPTPPTPPTPGGSPEPTPETPPKPPTGGSGEPAPETHPKDGGTGQPATTTTPAASSTPTVPQPAAPAAPPPAAPTAPVVVVMVEPRQRTTTARKLGHKLTATRGRPATGGAKGPKVGSASASNTVALPPQVIAAEARALEAAFAGSAASAQALAYYRIPPFLLPIYQAAGAQYAVPWQILAAINEIETNYGNDLSVSSAGAVGWMQFMPRTWLQYGVDALDAGYADPYNPVDAIFAAARYLHAAGASSNLRAAIRAYNHSEEYVNSVLLRARLISTYPKSVIGTLTGLFDAGLPVSGKQLVWEALASARTPWSATADATALAYKTASSGSARPMHGAFAPPSPTALAAVATGAAAPVPQLVDLMSAPNAAVLAVQDGRILQLGISRRLGKYVVLRDIFGDVFTYAGLGSIAPSNTDARAPRARTVPSADHQQRRLHRSTHARPLRAGSVVLKGTVLGHVRVPNGAKDGHLRFAIRPAGDLSSIDPRPILANWKQLHAALYPQGARGNASLFGATASLKATAAKAHSAGAGSTSPWSYVLSSQLSTTQWDQLVARIAVLPAPIVAVKPSSSAVVDPQA